ncbi:MAG: creatininase family protein, partial [Maribacter sp.]|nr:creatininase family protein [Maribacter sp.]
MIRPYVLAETNWEHLKDEQIDLAVLPWGATEAHNYHLPYGTDNYQAQSMVESAAKISWEKGKKIIVLPTIPYGVNTGQSDIYLDMNLNPST